MLLLLLLLFLTVVYVGTVLNEVSCNAQEGVVSIGVHGELRFVDKKI